MKRRGLSNWRREDIFPWALVSAGTFLLVGQLAILLRDLEVLKRFPEFSVVIVTAMLGLALLAFLLAAVMFPWTTRTYSTWFDLVFPQTAQRIEALLKEAEIPYRRDDQPTQRLFIWRPDVVFVLDRPALLVQLRGAEWLRRRYGAITWVYVGRFTRDTKEETRRLLTILNRIEGP